MAQVLKNLPAKSGDVGDISLIPGTRRSPGGGNGNPLQYSCLGNPMDRGAWRATVLGVLKSQTWLNMCAHTVYIPFSRVSSVRWWSLPLCHWTQALSYDWSHVSRSGPLSVLAHGSYVPLPQSYSALSRGYPSRLGPKLKMPCMYYLGSCQSEMGIERKCPLLLWAPETQGLFPTTAYPNVSWLRKCFYLRSLATTTNKLYLALRMMWRSKVGRRRYYWTQGKGSPGWIWRNWTSIASEVIC